MSVPGLKQTIRREILAREQTLVGTVVSGQSLVIFDASGSGAESWVCDVDIGSNRILKDVVIKAGTRGRFHAQLGQSVAVRRNVLGRFDVVGPADRVVAGAVITSYDLNAGSATGSGQAGFQIVPRAFDYYQGAIHMTGSAIVTFAGTPHTISRATGSFIADGFLAGQTLRVAGAANAGNNGTRSPTVVAALALTFASGLVDEGPTAAGAISIAVNSAGRWADAVASFPKIDVISLATGLPV